jgi:hypothetical protein
LHFLFLLVTQSMTSHITRRRFTLAAAATIAARRLPAQTTLADVAAMESPHILADAPAALTAQPSNLPELSLNIATLTAAYVLTQKPAYSQRAGELVTTWLITPATRLSSQPTQAITELVPFAELAVALRFLVDDLPAETLTAVNAFLSDLLQWLNTSHPYVIARDTKDHRASAWLLIVSALARGQRDERILDQCRHRLRTPTLRNQINADGIFPQELATPNPLRNTLYNFDLLTGACQLLSSPFDDVWHYELIDGISLRVVAAALFPILGDRAKWPGVSDADSFRDVPLRRPGLLFSGRAFQRQEYVALFRSLPTEVPAALAASVPIRQPLLWTTRAAHGL